MSRIGIIDCDLLSKSNHRFPNLACMKISAYCKSKGAETHLIKSWDDSYIDECDKLFVSKVFTDTEISDSILNRDNVVKGGTGFYFDKAKPLPDEIEHIMPDYTLYYDYIKQFKYSKKLRKQFEYYIDYSIGFTTRGCFRKCEFCVNKKYDHSFIHSNLKEFYDPSKKYICLLDDNVLSNPNWKSIISELQSTNKPFQFKQGLDERLLTEEKCEMLFNSKYHGDYIFAFDNIEDYDLIEQKLKLIRRYTDSECIKFYVLVGYKSTGLQDIKDMFRRIELLFRYGCYPYIMRYQSQIDKPFMKSKYKGLYINVARWCNQVNIVKRLSFKQFAEREQEYRNKTSNSLCSSYRAMVEFQKEYPKLAEKCFNLKFKRHICKEGKYG